MSKLKNSKANIDPLEYIPITFTERLLNTDEEFPLFAGLVNRFVICPKVCEKQMLNYEEFYYVYVTFVGQPGGMKIKALCRFHTDTLRNAFKVMALGTINWDSSQDIGLFNYAKWTYNQYTSYINNDKFTDLKQDEPIYWWEIVQVIEYEDIPKQPD